jgi:hypothetical protein
LPALVSVPDAGPPAYPPSLPPSLSPSLPPSLPPSCRRLLRPFCLQDTPQLHHYRGPHGARPQRKDRYGPTGMSSLPPSLPQSLSPSRPPFSLPFFARLLAPSVFTDPEPSSCHPSLPPPGPRGPLRVPLGRRLRRPHLPLRPPLPRQHHHHAHASCPGREGRRAGGEGRRGAGGRKHLVTPSRLFR